MPNQICACPACKGQGYRQITTLDVLMCPVGWWKMWNRITCRECDGKGIVWQSTEDATNA